MEKIFNNLQQSSCHDRTVGQSTRSKNTMNLGSPISPPSGPATGSFNGLQPKSNFLAIDPVKLSALLPRISCCLLAIFSASCGISKLPPESRNYLDHKINTALSSSKGTYTLEKMNFFGKSMLSIDLKSIGRDDEKRCFKVVHALSRDPKIPMVDYINVSVVGTIASHEVQVAMPRYSATCMEGNVPVTIEGIQTYTTGQSGEKRETIIASTIKRDALLRGEEPNVTIRHDAWVGKKSSYF